jgi:hypothetical protein
MATAVATRIFDFVVSIRLVAASAIWASHNLEARPV